MKLKIYKHTLEKLIKSALNKSYNPKLPLPSLSVKEDQYLLSADENSYVIDNFHQVPCKRERHSVTIEDWNKVKNLMQRHNIIADAHTHPGDFVPDEKKAKPSDGDIEFRKVWRRKFDKDLYMMIISNTAPYVMAMSFIKLERRLPLYRRKILETISKPRHYENIRKACQTLIKNK